MDKLMNNQATKPELKIIRDSKKSITKASIYSPFNCAGDFIEFFIWLMEALKYKGMSKTRFAEIMGVQKSYISNLESGYRKMSMKQLVFFADLLKLNQKEKLSLYEKIGGE